MAVSVKHSEEIEVADDEHTYEKFSIAKQSKVNSEVGMVTASDPQLHLEQEKLLDQLHSLKMVSQFMQYSIPSYHSSHNLSILTVFSYAASCH